MEKVAVGDISVLRVDRQSLEVNELDFTFLAILSSHVRFGLYINDTTLFLSFLQTTSFSFSISPFAFRIYYLINVVDRRV